VLVLPGQCLLHRLFLRRVVHGRADPADMSTLDGNDERRRAELIAERIRDWKSITKA
jgi:hypothetical protein